MENMIKIKKKDVLLVVLTSALYNIASVAFLFFLMNIVDNITNHNYQAFRSSIIWALIVISLQIIFLQFTMLLKERQHKNK